MKKLNLAKSSYGGLEPCATAEFIYFLIPESIPLMYTIIYLFIYLIIHLEAWTLIKLFSEMLKFSPKKTPNEKNAERKLLNFQEYILCLWK